MYMITACVGATIESISGGAKEAKFIVADHERRAHEMGAYLTSFAAERTYEGKFIGGKVG